MLDEADQTGVQCVEAGGVQMQTFDFVKQSDVEETFRVARIASDFDLKTEKITETFRGSITIPKDWSIGVIVGKSGTGKTSIARKLFPEYIANGKYEFNRKSVIGPICAKTTCR